MADIALPMWSVHDVFVQANVMHGYRYLDLTGVLLNVLADRYKQVNLISPAGTSLSDPADQNDPLEIQFSSKRVWLHFVGTEAVQKIEKTAPEMIKSIIEKLEMKDFDRFGVRVVYFAAAKDILKAADAVTKKLISQPIGELVANQRLDVRTNIEVPLLFNNLEVMLRFRWIVITHPPVNPQDFSGNGLILDLDVGQRGNDPLFRRHDLSKLMSDAVSAHSDLLVKYGQPLLQGVEL
jgi:hypothetical protein